MYWKDLTNSFAELLGFYNVDQAEQTNTSAKIVDIVKDLLIFASVNCVEGSLYIKKKIQILCFFQKNI